MFLGTRLDLEAIRKKPRLYFKYSKRQVLTTYYINEKICLIRPELDQVLWFGIHQYVHRVQYSLC